MKCAAMNVRATFGMIMRKWKSAMLTVIGPPLANMMIMNRRMKSDAERKGSFSPSLFSGKYLDVLRLNKKKMRVDFMDCLWYYLITVRETKSHRNERGKIK